MSSRESYQYSGSGASGGGTSNNQVYGYDSTSAPAPKVSYICGECAQKVQLDKEDKIRCSHCGHRVLYKERTKRMVQFEAR